MSVVLVESAGRPFRVAPIISLLVAAGAVAIATTPVDIAMAVGVWCGVVLAAAFVDARTGRLPDALVLPGTVAVVGLAILAGEVTGALAGALLFAVPLLVVHVIRPDGLGFGDVKYAVLLGAGIGMVAVPLVVPAYLLAALGHVLLCCVVRARGRLVPFGPALAMASITVATIGLAGVS